VKRETAVLVKRGDKGQGGRRKRTGPARMRVTFAANIRIILVHRLTTLNISSRRVHNSSPSSPSPPIPSPWNTHNRITARVRLGVRPRVLHERALALERGGEGGRRRVCLGRQVLVCCGLAFKFTSELGWGKLGWGGVGGVIIIIRSHLPPCTRLDSQDAGSLRPHWWQSISSWSSRGRSRRVPHAGQKRSAPMRFAREVVWAGMVLGLSEVVTTMTRG